MPSVKTRLNYSFFFDAAEYLRANPDVDSDGMDPLVHWVIHGRDEERRGLRKNPHAPLFDSGYYLRVYPDVVALIRQGIYVSAPEHWKMAGLRDVAMGNRSIDATFNPATYLAARPDVLAVIGSDDILAAYDHWLCWGRHELGLCRDPVLQSLPLVISSEKAAFWADNGYVILEGLISPGKCEAANSRLDHLWNNRADGEPPVSIDVYIDRDGASRIPFADAPDDARSAPYKINDLVMYDDVIGSVALDERLCEGLAWVLDDQPVAIGSLNFERGSTQEFHTDTLYMPGDTIGGMTAAWIALEDVSLQAGPLFYYPRSHKIPLFLFSDGRPNQIDQEFHHYREYMQRYVRSMDLVPEAFLPKQGDVLIWHERLFHSGGVIEDMTLTRKSLVVHYWRQADMEGKELIRRGGGSFWNRPPLT